jgi:AmmeMemoRadiSam system protein A
MQKKQSKQFIEFFLSDEEATYCTTLARKSIDFALANDSLLVLSADELKSVPKKLLEKKACFVTLTTSGELRGCIGHLAAIQPLYLDIIENAFSAAFSDPRFPALSKKEFSKIKIEVSVLTSPEELNFSGPSDLLKKLVPKKDGLIITKGQRSATFLPSVWEELPEKEDFLSHLCMKAGLDAKEWLAPGLKVQRYYAIKASE